MPNMTETTYNIAAFSREIHNVESLTLKVTEVGVLAAGLILARDESDGKGAFYARSGENGLTVPRFCLMSETEVSEADKEAGEIEVRVMTAGEVRADMISTAAGDEIDWREADGLNSNNIIVSSNTAAILPEM